MTKIIQVCYNKRKGEKQMKKNIPLQALKLSILPHDTRPHLKKIKLYAKTDLITLDYTGVYDPQTNFLSLERKDPQQAYRLIHFSNTTPSKLITTIMEFIAYEHKDERKTQDHYNELRENGWL